MPIPVIGLHRHYYEKIIAKRKGDKRKFSFPNGKTLIYKLFGISTPHLEHELILLFSSVSITTASSMSLYRYTFPTPRDIYYIVMTFLWFSRYIIHRIICTTDTNSTQHGPNDGWRFINSFIARFQWLWISMTSGGQYYDVPLSMLTRIHAKEEISNDFSNGEEINYNTSGFHESFVVRVFLLRPICFIVSSAKWFARYLRPKQVAEDLDWIPPEKPSRRGSHTGASTTSQDVKRKVQGNEDSFRNIYGIEYRRMRYSVSMCWNHLPQAQAVIFFGALCLCSLQLYMHYSVWKMNSIFKKRSSMFGISFYNDPDFENEPLNSMIFERKFLAKHNFGRSNIELLYSPVGVLCTIMTIGCLGSLLFFGRLILPIPDLVASPQEFGRHKSHVKKIGTPWCEKYRSITNADRFELHFTVILLRVLEYFILCFSLPRSEYICKATGHCDIDVTIFEMGPLAINGESGRRMYDRLIYDSFLMWVIGIITILITFLVLLSSAVTLDRSYLAMKAFLYQEEASGSSKRSGMKKGGQLDFDFSEFLAQSPDIKKGPFATLKQMMSTFKKSVYSVFVDEVGPLSTSHILSICSSIHLGISIFVTVLFLFYYITGRYWHPLVVIYLSLFSTVFELGAIDSFGLQSLADVISLSQKIPVKEMDYNKENKRK